MSISIMKLVNGDEIISSYEEKDGKIILDSPAKLLIRMDEGGMGAGLIPWNIFTEQKEFKIDPNHVITYIEPSTDLRNEYNSQFGSGIEIVEEPGKRGNIIV